VTLTIVPTTRRIPEDDTRTEATEVLVMGSDTPARAVAKYLTGPSHSVTVVSPESTVAIEGVEALQREITNADDVRRLAEDVADVDLVVAVGSDERALFMGYLARREFEPCVVVAGVDDPVNERAFEGTGVECVCVAELLADAIYERYA
jgi:Trk K+ transport system NAD-binding subunit